MTLTERSRLPGLLDAVAVIFIIIVSGALFVSLLHPEPTVLNNAAITLLFFSLIPLTYIRFRNYPVAEAFQFRPPRWWQIVLACVLAVVLLLILYALQPAFYALLKSLKIDVDTEIAPIKRIIHQSISVHILYAFFFLGIVPAFVEEMFFRGFLMGILARRFGALSALLITSLLFALIHIQIPRVIPTFILGLFFGTCVLWTRSMWPAMAAHSVNNIAALLILWQNPG